MRFLLLLFLALAGSLGAVPLHTELIREAAVASKAGDNATALAKLQEAAQLRPDFPRLQLNLARNYAALHQPEDALNALERIAAMGVSLNLAGDPALVSLAKLPRFQEIASRLAALPVTPNGELAAMQLPDITGIIESVLLDPATGDWYFGDVRNRCIWKRDAGGALRKFTRAGEKLDGVFKLALAPDGKTLWAGTASVEPMADPDADEGERAALVSFNLADGRVLARYPTPPDGHKHLLGDFIFAPDGTIYATDSFSPVIWRLQPRGARLTPWLENEDFLSLQGLAFNADCSRLFVADYSNGIWRIDVATQGLALLAPPANATFFGIDGLYAVPGGLLAVQNGVNPQRVLRITPSANDKSAAVQVVASGQPAMTDLALGTVANGHFHFVANSGWALFDPLPKKIPAAHTVTVYSLKLEP